MPPKQETANPVSKPTTGVSGPTTSVPAIRAAHMHQVIPGTSGFDSTHEFKRRRRHETGSVRLDIILKRAGFIIDKLKQAKAAHVKPFKNLEVLRKIELLGRHQDTWLGRELSAHRIIIKI